MLHFAQAIDMHMVDEFDELFNSPGKFDPYSQHILHQSPIYFLRFFLSKRPSVVPTSSQPSDRMTPNQMARVLDAVFPCHLFTHGP